VDIARHVIGIRLTEEASRVPFDSRGEGAKCVG